MIDQAHNAETAVLEAGCGEVQKGGGEAASVVVHIFDVHLCRRIGLPGLYCQYYFHAVS